MVYIDLTFYPRNYIDRDIQRKMPHMQKTHPSGALKSKLYIGYPYYYYFLWCLDTRQYASPLLCLTHAHTRAHSEILSMIAQLHVKTYLNVIILHPNMYVYRIHSFIHTSK